MVKFSSRTWKENFNCCINKSLLRFFPPRFLWRTHCAVTFLWKDNFWENICYISLSCSPSKRGALGAVVEVISILISMRALLLSRHNGCCIHLLPTPRSTKKHNIFPVFLWKANKSFKRWELFYFVHTMDARRHCTPMYHPQNGQKKAKPNCARNRCGATFLSTKLPLISVFHSTTKGFPF